MIKTNLLGMLLYLCVATMIFPQGSSCRETKTNNNSTSTVEKKVPAQKNAEAMMGAWGGQHVLLKVNEAGATIEFDCAHGVIEESIVPDRDGKFIAKGTFVREGPGPTRQGEAGQSATSEGSVTDVMRTLTV